MGDDSMLRDFDSVGDFDTHAERSDPEPEEWLLEPDAEEDPEERDRALEEWAAEATPADWWQSQVDSTSTPEAERLESIVEDLVNQKCRRVDLLLALQAIAQGYWDRPPAPQRLRKLAAKYLELADFLPLSTGNDFRLKDFLQMVLLMRRCGEHLRVQADSGTFDYRMFRRELVMSLLALVRRQTGRPHYRVVSELLLILAGDPTLTPGNLRQISRRGGVTKQQTLRPTFKRRRPLKKGRPVRRDEQEKEEWTRAQIAVGNWSERRSD